MKRPGSILCVLLCSLTAPLAIASTAHCQTGESEYDHRYDEHGRWIDHDYSYRSYGAYSYSDYDYNHYDYDGEESGTHDVEVVADEQHDLAENSARHTEGEIYESYEHEPYEYGYANRESDEEDGYGSYNQDGYEDLHDNDASRQRPAAAPQAESENNDYSDYDCMYRETGTDTPWTSDASSPDIDGSLHFVAAQGNEAVERTSANTDEANENDRGESSELDAWSDHDAAYGAAVYGLEGDPIDELISPLHADPNSTVRAVANTAPGELETGLDEEVAGTDETGSGQPAEAEGNLEEEISLGNDVAVPDDVAADNVELYEEFGDPGDVASDLGPDYDPIELITEPWDGSQPEGLLDNDPDTEFPVQRSDESNNNPCVEGRDSEEATSLWSRPGLVDLASKMLTAASAATAAENQLVTTDPCVGLPDESFHVECHLADREPVLIHAARTLEGLGAALTNMAQQLRDISAAARVTRKHNDQTIR